ncbi:MAG: DUF4249 domain-containing protein [Bacteroidia bacterium]|nr:DUF4249 domain-containing protein [Bacteroidia bacterium]
MNHHRLFKSIVFITLSFVLFSCEKVIDLELDESSSRIVIEANLLEGENQFIVSVSQTASYYDSSLPMAIEDAEVRLTDNTNKVTYDIPHQTNGLYIQNVEGLSNTSYTLSVMHNGNEYTAVSYLPKEVELSKLEIEEDDDDDDEGNYRLFVRFHDPAGERNFYRVVYTRMGEKVGRNSSLNITDDDFFDGGHARLRFRGNRYDLGDTVAVDLIHMDQASFEYFSSLEDILGSSFGPGGPSAAAPGNPTTNWSLGAVGYFTAGNANRKVIIIK